MLLAYYLPNPRRSLGAWTTAMVANTSSLSPAHKTMVRWRSQHSAFILSVSFTPSLPDTRALKGLCELNKIDVSLIFVMGEPCNERSQRMTEALVTWATVERECTLSRRSRRRVHWVLDIYIRSHPTPGASLRQELPHNSFVRYSTDK